MFVASGNPHALGLGMHMVAAVRAFGAPTVTSSSDPADPHALKQSATLPASATTTLPLARFWQRMGAYLSGGSSGMRRACVKGRGAAGRCSRVRSPVAVAVVSQDDLLVQRIRDGLSRDGITIAERSNDPSDLSERAAGAIAIVLAGYTSADVQRAVIRGAKARFPDVPAVLVASVSSNGVRKALDAGASAVLLASDVEAALPETIRAAAANLTVVPGRFRQDAARPPLSHREKETLALVARGLTNREIAAQLYLAESTIKTHLASVFAKLGVGSRSEATALVLDPEDGLGLGLSVLAPAN